MGLVDAGSACGVGSLARVELARTGGGRAKILARPLYDARN